MVPGTSHRLHTHGVFNGDWNELRWNLPIPTSPDGTAYTIKAGDKLCFLQYNSNAVGGIGFGYSDGSGTAWQWSDTEGASLNQFTPQNVWSPRCTDLTEGGARNGETFGVAILTDVWTGAGTWDIYYAEMSITSLDGSVTQVDLDSPTYGDFQNSGGNGWQGTPTATPETVSAALDPTLGAQAATTHFYFGDHLGTAQMEFAAGGWPLYHGQFAPYGQELQANGSLLATDAPDGSANHYKFTGKERDAESGLDLMGARYFASSMGRFMSPDPIYIADHRLADPQLLNLYQYGRNNPLSFTDTTGLDVTLDCSKVSGAQCQQSVTDLNNRQGAQFQTSRNDKTGLLEVDGKVDTSKLSKGEAALYGAITDTANHATLSVVAESGFVHFGEFNGGGHNAIDRSDLDLLGKASSQAPGEVIAHEALEAYKSSFGLGYDVSHAYANQFFGQVTHPDEGGCGIGVCNPAWSARQWNFGRLNQNFAVKTILTPVPDAKNYEYEPGKIVEVKKVQP